jgi:hypothetical protein
MSTATLFRGDGDWGLCHAAHSVCASERRLASQGAAKNVEVAWNLAKDAKTWTEGGARGRLYINMPFGARAGL